MSKRIQVIALNSEHRKIRTMSIETLGEMQALVGGLIERAHVFPNGDELYVNEEGLFGDKTHWFRVKGGMVPFVGNAFIMGNVDRRGENTDVKTTVEAAHKIIEFCDYETIRRIL